MPAHRQIYYVGSQITDDTILWRYIRLSSLLMLLVGKVFIPTIDTLRRDDPAEARTLCLLTRKRFESLGEEDRECLLRHATRAESTLIRSKSDDAPRVFANIWRREIGKRRCAWCWY